MAEADLAATRFFKSACIFEAALLPLAIALSWLMGVDPFKDLSFSELAVFYGLVGTLPLILLFYGLQNSNARAISSARDLVMNNLVSRLHKRQWADLLILSTIAGVAEEVLFRGTLQPWLELTCGGVGGLLLSSLIFGLLHAVTLLYALIAVLVSIYLGLALDYGDTRNLLIPIIIHSCYDFIAFLAMVRFYKQHYLAETIPSN